MEHVDWLHPDHIILANSSSDSIYKKFTKDMRSRNYSHLRMLKISTKGKSGKIIIRYKIDSNVSWFICEIMQQKEKDYYISLSYPDNIVNIKLLEKSYLKFDREDKLNDLLK